MKRILSYIAALLIGGFLAFFVVFNSIFTDSSGVLGERMLTYLIVMISYGVLGALFGFLKPDTSWHWVIWLTAPAVLIILLYSFQEPGQLLLNMIYLVLTLFSAALGSYLGSRLAVKRH